MQGLPVVNPFYALTSLAPAAILLAALPLALLAAARMDRLIPRVRATRARMPIRSLLVGGAVGLSVLLLLAASNASPIFGIPALLALVAGGFLSLAGLAAEARDLGCALRDRDPAAGGVEGGSTAVGWLVLAGTPLVLAAGPVVILFLAIRSTGATAVALAGERETG